ncbi:hypothetical protein TBR22_A26480 [Luteitalea sp. TBR-22]|uniref:hypothetical protein n=1 Tax=Luteitalea sp. TBR-22 TaxID=2802971 RepID=UPI001AF7A9CC|nr:hypothetical protein [Luteitalea sp. TBR-22]BCS33421.1 hypothetical protein TBR22_A26480 [Luteitalea sp. TBR-22]
MLRLVERLFGEGRLHDARAEASPTPVAFELDVYRDWYVEGADLLPGAWVIEGHVLAAPEVLAAWTGRGDPFSLHLDDGRQLAVFILDGEGRVVNVEGTSFTTSAR